MNSSQANSSLAQLLADRPYWQVCLESAILSMIDFTALAGNIIVWLAVVRNPSLRHLPTNLFVLSLSASDILMACTSMPLSLAVLFQGRWSLGNIACQFHGFFYFVLAFVSLETVALVAINRYLNVAKPRIYRSMFTRKNSLAMIIMIWIVCIFYVGIFEALQGPIFYFHPGKLICHIRLKDPAYKNTWNIITGVLFAVLPMVTLFLCYYKLFRAVRRHNRMTVRSLRKHCSFRSCNHDEIRITKVILAIMVGFCCCWVPSFAIAYLKLIDPRLLESRIPHLMYIYLVYSSSMINPIIYGILNSTFRSEFIKILTCRGGSSKGGNGTSGALEMRRPRNSSTQAQSRQSRSSRSQSLDNNALQKQVLFDILTPRRMWNRVEKVLAVDVQQARKMMMADFLRLLDTRFQQERSKVVHDATGEKYDDDDGG